jgi:hypothetical protein
VKEMPLPKGVLSNFKFGFLGGLGMAFLSDKLSSYVSDRLFWTQ